MCCCVGETSMVKCKKVFCFLRICSVINNLAEAENWCKLGAVWLLGIKIGLCQKKHCTLH